MQRAKSTRAASAVAQTYIMYLMPGLLMLLGASSVGVDAYTSTATLSASRARRPCTRASGSDESAENDKRPNKSTKFDRTIDDFIGKRYGAGEAFYGRRVSDLDEAAYAQMREVSKPKRFDDKPPRDNAVLIYGDLEAAGQFVAYELAEKGFNIRILTDNVKSAVQMFGLAGNNVDMFELKADSSLEFLSQAMDGVQAVILCGNFNPVISLGLMLDGRYRRYLEVAGGLIDAAEASKRVSKKSALQKVVLVSRYAPSGGGLSRGPLALLNPSSLYAGFMAMAEELEERVRSSSFEYAVVRAPPQVQRAREGARYDLCVSQSYDEESEGGTVGVLDLAECASQALLLDVSGVTFSVRELLSEEQDDDAPLIESSAMDREYGPTLKREVQSQRVRRRAYYSILDMDDADMRASYMIKPQEAYLAQIEEDRLLDKYWTRMLGSLKRDVLR